jgi:hypothetical protein
MLDADRQALSSSVYHQALEVKQRELRNVTEYLHNIGTIAALLFGFGVALFFEGFVDMPLILQFIYYTSAATCIGSEMYCIASSTFCTVFAPTLALNGPRGSVHVAVAGMYEERGGIWKMMALGMFSFYVATVAKAWIVLWPGQNAGKLAIAGFVTCLFIAIGVVIVRAARRCFQRFTIESMATSGLTSKGSKHHHQSAEAYLRAETSAAALRKPTAETMSAAQKKPAGRYVKKPAI